MWSVSSYFLYYLDCQFLVFSCIAFQRDLDQPDIKLKQNPTVKATMLTAKSDNAVWSPSLWRLSEVLFHAPLKELRIITGGLHVRCLWVPVFQFTSFSFITTYFLGILKTLGVHPKCCYSTLLWEIWFIKETS